jgi:hypothetical protein
MVGPAPTLYNRKEYDASEVDQAKVYEMKRICSSIQAYEPLVWIPEGRYHLEKNTNTGLIQKRTM